MKPNLLARSIPVLGLLLCGAVACAGAVGGDEPAGTPRPRARHPRLGAPQDPTAPPGDPAHTGSAPSPTGSSPPTPPPGMSSPTPAPPGAMATCTGAPRPRLRRLGRLEYGNATRELLGTTLNPASTFAEDESSGAFFANLATSVSAAELRAYMESAEALAADAASRLEALLPCPMTEGRTCALRWLRDLGLRAFRRPVTEDELTALGELFTAGGDFRQGARLALEALLQSPHFLYLVEDQLAGTPGTAAPLSPYELAQRLASFLWRSIPDAPLLDAAAKGQLATTAEVEAQARRMVADRRFAGVAEYLVLQWLGFYGTESVPPFDQIEKDEKILRAWRPALRRPMKAEVMALGREAFTGGRNTAWLFAGGSTILDAPLARFYGLPEPAAATAVTLPPDGPRIGLLTTAGVLALHGHEVQSAPVQRGVLVRQRILCLADVPPPPPGISADPPPFDPRASAREQLTLLTSEARCVACHQLFNPIGFLFEAYDGSGQHRATDGGKPVDASGSVPASDIAGALVGAVELSRRLGTSAQATGCLARQVATFALGALDEGGPGVDCRLRELERAFVADGGNLGRLPVRVARSELFRLRETVTP